MLDVPVFNKFSLEKWQSELPSHNKGQEPEIYQNTNRAIKVADDEEFSNFPYPSRIGKSIVVSSFGRVWVDGVMKIEKDNGVYIIKKGDKCEQVHRLVAITWFMKYSGIYNAKTSEMVVHHIDRNGFNNHYSNLLLVTYAQHTMIHLKGIILTRENDQLEFRGDEYYLKQGINQIIGKFEITDKIIWVKRNDEWLIEDIKYKIKFGKDEPFRDFSGDIWKEIYISGDGLLSGKWKNIENVKTRIKEIVK
jgi:hypothetical protein